MRGEGKEGGQEGEMQEWKNRGDNDPPEGRFILIHIVSYVHWRRAREGGSACKYVVCVDGMFPKWFRLAHSCLPRHLLCKNDAVMGPTELTQCACPNSINPTRTFCA